MLNDSDLRNKTLLTVTEVQHILGISRSSAYDFLRNEPPFRVLHINHTIRIPSKDFFGWIDNE